LAVIFCIFVVRVVPDFKFSPDQDQTGYPAVRNGLGYQARYPEDAGYLAGHPAEYPDIRRVPDTGYPAIFFLSE